MTADRVLDDRPHRTAAVGIEDVAGGDVDGVGVVDGPAGRQPLGRIRFRERDEIRDLLAKRIDDLQPLAALDDQSRPGLRFEVEMAQHGHRAVLTVCVDETGSASRRRVVAPGVLARLGVLAEVGEVGIDRALEGEVARADAVAKPIEVAVARATARIARAD